MHVEREDEGDAKLAEALGLIDGLAEGETLEETLEDGLTLGVADEVGWVSLLGHPYSEIIWILYIQSDCSSCVALITSAAAPGTQEIFKCVDRVPLLHSSPSR